MGKTCFFDGQKYQCWRCTLSNSRICHYNVLLTLACTDCISLIGDHSKYYSSDFSKQNWEWGPAEVGRSLLTIGNLNPKWSDWIESMWTTAEHPLSTDDEDIGCILQVKLFYCLWRRSNVKNMAILSLAELKIPYELWCRAFLKQRPTRTQINGNFTWYVIHALSCVRERTHLTLLSRCVSWQSICAQNRMIIIIKGRYNLIQKHRIHECRKNILTMTRWKKDSYKFFYALYIMDCRFL